MARETREMAVGLQLGETSALLTYFNTSMKEPVTLEPDSLSENERHIIRVEKKVWDSARGVGEPIETLCAFLKEALAPVLQSVQPKDIRIMVSLPKLERLISQRLPQALEMIGLQRRSIYLQDYLSSFYYYTINQKRELWHGDVALLECSGEVMTGYVMHTDWSKAPALVRIEKAGVQKMDEKARDGRNDADWDRERDRLFFEFLKKVFERRNVVTVYLVGDYFSREWAVRSFQFLVTRRHAFQGKNLYTRGACYAAMERCGMIRGQDILFIGSDIIRENLGMNMRVRGREVYYPLVTAGVNWYEAHHECEFIPDGEKSIVIQTKPMEGGAEVSHILRLTGFPDRPNRATRMHMSLYFTAPDCCCVEVEDLGFGGFYRPSGKKWKRSIRL